MPARRTISGEFEQPGAPASGPVHSSVHELEPSDSERPTEVPQSDERLTAAGRAVLGNEIETIPAPALPEED